MAKTETTTNRPSEGIGARIYEWRMDNGVSLRRIAIDTGTAYSCLWRIETCNHMPTVELIERLADYMGVKRGWLAWGE